MLQGTKGTGMVYIRSWIYLAVLRGKLYNNNIFCQPENISKAVIENSKKESCQQGSFLSEDE